MITFGLYYKVATWGGVVLHRTRYARCAWRDGTRVGRIEKVVCNGIVESYLAFVGEKSRAFKVHAYPTAHHAVRAAKSWVKLQIEGAA